MSVSEDPTPAPAGWGELTRTWAGVGLMSFGGPSAQIALMHRVLVEEKRWLSEQRFLGALSFCMLLPGPEAMQLATFSGWRTHGVAGGLIAGLLFVAPGAVVMLALAAIYAAWGATALIETLFLGVKSAVLVVVLQALARIAGRALTDPLSWLVAAGAFVAIFFFAAPFPLILIAAAAIGAVAARAAPPGDRPDVALPDPGPTLRAAALWTAIWLAPLIGLGLIPGAELLAEIGWFFAWLAVVTFGGAYAVLAYMAQAVVADFGWLTPGQMIDGLGLAETTPGPLILVTQFVGFIAAFQHGGAPAWAFGLAGAAVALWATFAPCFLWIFVGAPYVEWLDAQPRLRGALAGVTAAVVGVILNLSLWFALHVFFGAVDRIALGPLTLWTPDPATLDPRVVALAALSAALLLWRGWSVPATLAAAAAAAAALLLAAATG